MATFTFAYAGMTVAWNPAEDEELHAVLARARAARQLIDASPQPVEQDPAPATYVPPKTPAEAEQRFYARYGEQVGGRDWRAVRQYLGVPDYPQPYTVEQWTLAAREVRARQRAAA
jgi:hypothetical protein